MRSRNGVVIPIMIVALSCVIIASIVVQYLNAKRSSDIIKDLRARVSEEVLKTTTKELPDGKVLMNSGIFTPDGMVLQVLVKYRLKEDISEQRKQYLQQQLRNHLEDITWEKVENFGDPNES